MTVTHGEYALDDDLKRMDMERVHSWLTTSYWSPGVGRDLVEKAFSRSDLVVGAYQGELQVGVLRVVSDGTTFGWVCDVWVDESARKQGLSKAMVRFALDHPGFRGLRRWVLATKDAHPIYEACGFGPLEEPARWMIYKPNATWPPSA